MKHLRTFFRDNLFNFAPRWACNELFRERRISEDESRKCAYMYVRAFTMLMLIVGIPRAWEEGATYIYAF